MRRLSPLLIAVLAILLLAQAPNQATLRAPNGDHAIAIRPVVHTIVGVQMSVANVQGTSKIVLTLTAPAGYAIVKEPDAYTIRFTAPIHPPFADQTYDDPYVQRATFSGNNLRIQLTAPDVVGDAY